MRHMLFTTHCLGTSLREDLYHPYKLASRDSREYEVLKGTWWAGLERRKIHPFGDGKEGRVELFKLRE